MCFHKKNTAVVSFGNFVDAKIGEFLGAMSEGEQISKEQENTAHCCGYWWERSRLGRANSAHR